MIDFYRLILCLATSLNSCIIFSSLLTAHLELSWYLWVKEVFLPPFLLPSLPVFHLSFLCFYLFSLYSFMPFISFSCLNALARIFSMMLNKHYESRYPWPFLILGGNNNNNLLLLLFTIKYNNSKSTISKVVILLKLLFFTILLLIKTIDFGKYSLLNLRSFLLLLVCHRLVPWVCLKIFQMFFSVSFEMVTFIFSFLHS